MKGNNPGKKIPAAGTVQYKTEWDFTDLYKDINDPKLEADVADLERRLGAFAKKYQKREDYLKDESALFSAIREYSQLQGFRPLWYLKNSQNKNSSDSAISAKLGLYEPRLIKAFNEVVFFQLKLGRIDRKKQGFLLKSKKLSLYKHFLKQIFIAAKHHLSEAEEKIINLKSRAARELWIDGTEKLVSAQTVKWGGRDIPLSEASSLIPHLPAKKRRELHDLMTGAYKKASHFAESEINALYSDKQVMDELRKFDKPYSETILGYQNDVKSIENLVATVTKNFPISHEFYKLKARIMNEPSLCYADRAADIGQASREFSFDESVAILRKCFGEADPEFLAILDSMLRRGRIDVYPQKGKQGGAYCWSAVDAPTVVLLNHVPSMKGVMTFAHEMGHAIHYEFARTNDKIYFEYTMSVAEVASTFFENLAFEEVLASLSEEEKIVALHDRIMDYVSNAFRQIACFNFELELHQEMRAKGALSAGDMAAIHNKHMSAYLGKAVSMKESDGYMFVGWSHIRNFFYVYSYSYGILISNAMYKKYKEDRGYIHKVKEFMKKGGSMTPEDIFKSIGIDTSRPEFFEEGLMNIKAEIGRLRKIMDKKGKAGAGNSK